MAETGNVAKATEFMIAAPPGKECHDIYRNKGSRLSPTCYAPMLSNAFSVSSSTKADA